MPTISNQYKSSLRNLHTRPRGSHWVVHDDWDIHHVTRMESAHGTNRTERPPLNRFSFDSPDNLRQRLENANRHFRRKAAEVFTDDAALRLLATMYEDVIVDIPDFDLGKHGLSLAKLTAAHFCEIGANVIYITESGQRFIESIVNAESAEHA